ncbi:hypothetical protein FSP39_004913 [Pinctada imbricata]|uniref:RRM domain-containing protein n=1 Tax=Pinctada imbricata TaxID=66713 RepID=A0AA88YB52_PINIB|nr:hypothetical protein FSP39_004913 [Pinctada imbricata]
MGPPFIVPSERLRWGYLAITVVCRCPVQDSNPGHPGPWVYPTVCMATLQPSGKNSSNIMETERRLFVGGLFSDVKEADLRQKFSRYGAIKDVEIRKKKEIDGKTDKTFAYINLNTTDGKMKTCIGVFNNTSWKGSKMTIQCAKEDFMKRLKEERENGFCVPDTKEKSILFNKPLEDNENVREFHMKGAVPGTPVTESKEWVVGKYGRVLPIDPSKFCHNLKKVDGSVPVREAGVADVLTWEIRARESDIVKRQQGEFPKWQPPKKIRRRSEDKNKQISNGFKESLPNKDKDRNEDIEDLEIIALGTKTLPGNRTYQSGSSDSESDYESMKSSLSKSTKKLIPGTNDLDQKQNQQRMLIQSSETSVGEKCKRNTTIENVQSHKATRLLGGNLKQNVENSSFSPSDIDMDSEDDKSHSDKESVSSVDTDEIIVRNMKSRGTHSYSTVLITAGSEINEFYSGSVDRFNESDDGDDENDIDDDIDILDENDDLVALARKIETEYRNKFAHTEDKKSMPKVKTTTTNSRTENETNINKRNVKDNIPLETEGISDERVAISPNPGSVDNLTKHKMSNQDCNSDSGASSADTDEIINKSQKSQKTKNQIQTQNESISEFYGAAPDLMDENSSEEDSVASENELPDTETDLRKLAHQIETEYKQSLKRSDRRVPGYSVDKEKSGDTNCQREKNLNRKNSTQNKNLEDSVSQAADKKIMNDSKICNDDDDDDDSDDDDSDDDDDDDDDDDSSDDDSSGDEDEEKDNDVIDKILSDHADLGKTEDDKSEGGIKKFRGTKHLFSLSNSASHMGDSSIPDKTRQVSSASSINTTRQDVKYFFICTRNN